MSDADTPKSDDAASGETKPRSWTEEIEVSSENLVAKIKQLAADVQVKRVRLIEPDGDIVLDIPLSFGAIAGGAVVLAAPLLAILGALTVFVAKVKLVIVREDDKHDKQDPAA